MALARQRACLQHVLVTRLILERVLQVPSVLQLSAHQARFVRMTVLGASGALSPPTSPSIPQGGANATKMGAEGREMGQNCE